MNPTNRNRRLIIDKSGDRDYFLSLIKSLQVDNNPFSCLQVKGIYKLISLATGLDRSNVSRVLRNYSGVSLETASKIASVLNVSLDQLYDYLNNLPQASYSSIVKKEGLEKKKSSIVLSLSDIELIRSSSESTRRLEKEIGVSRQTICNIRNNG